jgi:hypothetical protein
MEKQHKRILVKELFFDCPMGPALNSRLTRKSRKLPLEKRMKIVDEMKTAELDLLLKKQRECRHKRENELNKTIKVRNHV